MPSPIGCACATSAWPWTWTSAPGRCAPPPGCASIAPIPAAPLVLDTNGLAIAGVTGLDGKPRPYQLGAEDKVLGAPLTITLAARRQPR